MGSVKSTIAIPAAISEAALAKLLAVNYVAYEKKYEAQVEEGVEDQA